MGVAGGLTLEYSTQVLYKVTAPYSATNDCGIRWDDPAIAIDWPLGGATPTLSEKDRFAPTFAEVERVFSYAVEGAT